MYHGMDRELSDLKDRLADIRDETLEIANDIGKEWMALDDGLEKRLYHKEMVNTVEDLETIAEILADLDERFSDLIVVKQKVRT